MDSDGAESHWPSPAFLALAQRSPFVSRAGLEEVIQESHSHLNPPAGQDTFLLVGTCTLWGKGLDHRADVGLVLVLCQQGLERQKAFVQVSRMSGF